MTTSLPHDADEPRTRDVAGPVAAGADRPLDPEKTLRLLKLGISGPARPINEVLARLEMPNGGEWLALAMRRSPVSSLGLDRVQGSATPPSLERLNDVKDECKQFAAHDSDREARHQGVLGYFLTVAAGLAYHARLLSTRPRSELDPIFLDLAAATPEPLSSLLSRAAFTRT